MKKLTDTVLYVGVNDRDIDLFEGQYEVPNGMAYNSYVIKDGSTAVFDSVDARFASEWLDNVEKALEGAAPDYLIVQHMEPDHSSSITAFAEKYPTAKIVGNKRTFDMMKNFFGTSFDDRSVTVGDGETLSIGRHELTFILAPMVHWPEVMVTYDSFDKILFSADAFGKFGTLDTDEDWACEARRYYFGIVGKYGAQVQTLLKKASALDIAAICPLHGPILTEEIGKYIGLYDTWSSYKAESEGVMIAFTSVYGNTKKAVLHLEKELLALGCPKVVVCDLAREDQAEAVEDAFRYGKLVLATTTYNGEIFPFMKHFIDALVERGYKNRKVGFIENGSWAPVAAKTMKVLLEKCRDLSLADTTVTLRSAMTEENKTAVKALAKEMMSE